MAVTAFKPTGNPGEMIEVIFNAIPASLAVLDAAGRIVSVNASWRRFGFDNALVAGVMPSHCEVGADYLAICDAAQGADAGEARLAAAGIRSVLAGEQGEFRLEYPCHSPTVRRWFMMWVTPLQLAGPGVVVVHVDITTRKLAEMAARDNEIRLQLALEASGDGLWDWDVRTGETTLSSGYYSLTGYRPEEVSADYGFFRALVHPEDWPRVEATMQAHLRGETPESRIEYRMLTRSGAMRWIQGRGRVMSRDEAGQPLRMMGLISDITCLKDAELEQARLRAQSMAILNSNAVGLVRVAQRTIQEANLAMHAMFGYAGEELIGQPTRLLFPDDGSHARFGAALYPLLMAGKVYHGTEAMQRKDGSLGWYRVDISPLPEADGASVAAITDITHEKALEDALRVSEARYRGVVEDQTEAISRTLPDGTFVFVNQAFCRLFGKTKEALLSKRWQPAAHPDDLPDIVARLAGLTPDNPVVSIENRVFVGGMVRWMQFVNRGFFDVSGGLCEIQTVGRDITLQKQMEQAQKALLEENTRLGHELIRLQEQERTALARELHDEISQDLVAVRAHAHAICLRPSQGDDLARSDAQAIEQAARKLYEVSHRIMEGLHPHMLDDADLTESIGNLVDEWSLRHPGTRVRTRLLTPFLLHDSSTCVHLFRIAQACLANIAAHAQASKARLFLGAKQRHDQCVVHLTCRDNGVGMPESASGKGLGLLLMRERTRALGGRFSLWSQPGRGVRVAVEIPLPGPPEPR